MTSLVRRSDWPVHFGAFVRGRHSMPFAWGRNDCALFAADAVLAVTGCDLAVDMRGTYATAAEARHALARLGGLQAFASARLGPPMPVGRARVGDVCLLSMGAMPALGVCNGSMILGPGEQAMQIAPLAAALMCWGVG